MGGLIGPASERSDMAAKERPAFGMNHVTVVPENFELAPIDGDEDDEAG